MRKRKQSGRRRDPGKSRSGSAASRPPAEGWIYGWHAVIAALKNPHRKPGRLVATANAAERLKAEFPATAPHVMSRAELDELLPDSAVHQGIALDAPPPETPALEDILAEAPSDAVVVVLDQVTDPHNVGAILRSAAAFGATAVVVQDRTAPPPGGALAKAASGALDLVPLARVTNLARTLELLASEGFWRIGFDGAATDSFADAPLTGRTALVLGAEGSGLRRLTRENCDHLAHIATSGPLKTLNVSNATAIALYEIAQHGRHKD